MIRYGYLSAGCVWTFQWAEENRSEKNVFGKLLDENSWGQARAMVKFSLVGYSLAHSTLDKSRLSEYFQSWLLCIEYSWLKSGSPRSKRAISGTTCDDGSMLKYLSQNNILRVRALVLLWECHASVSQQVYSRQTQVHQLLCSMFKERRKNGLSELCKNRVGHSESKSLGMGGEKRHGRKVPHQFGDQWGS